MSDLNKLPVEELAALPDWLVPRGRKAEVEVFKARKRRGVTEKTTEEEEEEIREARRRAGLPFDGSKPNWIGKAGPTTPQPKTGPRGGRYTEDRTKDGRPYRRYF